VYTRHKAYTVHDKQTYYLILIMPHEFIKSNKGRDFLLADGFTFPFEKAVKVKKTLDMYRIG